MRRGTTVADPALPVVLSESAMLERGKQIASAIADIETAQERIEAIRARIAGLEEVIEAKAEITRKQELIKSRRETIHTLAETIRNQEEFRDQSTLTFDEDPTKAKEPARPEPALAEAQGALARIAANAEADETNPIEVDAAPSVCGRCGEPVREFMAGWMCTDNTCPWVAIMRGKNIRGEDVAPEEEDVRPKCSTCEVVLDADEVEKGLGLCQACIDDDLSNDGAGPDADEAGEEA